MSTEKNIVEAESAAGGDRAARRDALLSYWRNTLAGAPACLNLPFDRPRPVALSQGTGSVIRPLAGDLVNALKTLGAPNAGAGPLLLGLAILCARLARSDDVVIGTASAASTAATSPPPRTVPATTLPLRFAVRPDATIHELLLEAQDCLADGVAHHDLSFRDIVAGFELPEAAGYHPLCQVLCLLPDPIAAQSGLTPVKQAATVGADGGERSSGNVVSPAPGVDLTLAFEDGAEGLSVTLGFSTDLFDASTADGLLALYLELLRSMAEAPGDSPDKVWNMAATEFRNGAAAGSVTTDVLSRLANPPLSETGAWYPLSAAQRDLWLAEQAAPKGTSFATLAVMYCPQDIDRDRLEAAVRAIVQQSQAAWLRLSNDGLQGMAPEPTVSVHRFHVSSITPTDEGPLEVLEWAGKRSQSGIDGDFAIFCAPEQTLVAGSGHHLTADGWGILQYFDGICRNYATLGKDPQHRFATDRLFLPSLREDQLYRWSAAYGEDMAYWQNTLAGDLPQPLGTLIADLPHQPDRAPAVRAHTISLSAEFCSALSEVADVLSLSSSDLLTAITALYLARLAGEDEIVFSVPFANRTKKTLRTPAYFANVVPVRLSAPGALPVREALLAAAQAFRTALDHARLPFGDIVRATGLSQRYGEVSVNTLVARRGLAIDGQPATMQWLNGNPGGGLSFLFTQFDRNAPLQFQLWYDSKSFGLETVVRHGERLIGFAQNGFRALLTAPQTTISNLPLLGAEERGLVVSGVNAAAADGLSDKTVVDLFRAQADRQPEAIAVVDDDQQLGYGELDKSSNRLARQLVGLGIGPETIVGVCLERSARLILAMQGIWKAGGAYLPLDPEYPEERLRTMLDDSSAVAVVTTAAIADKFPALAGGDGDGNSGRRLVVLDDPDTEAALAAGDDASDNGSTVPPASDSLAYVIYTSGSTGKPKGVTVEHRSLANFLHAIRRLEVLDTNSVLISVSAVGFDLSIQDFCLPLAAGARLVFADRLRLSEPGYFGELTARTGATFLHTAPSVYQVLLEAGWRPAGNITLWTGAERLSPALAQRLKSGGSELWHGYGPTEATITASRQKVSVVEDRIPIGTPNANTRIYVVDDRLEPRPVGLAGELVIGGVQVARGYLGRPDLTAEKFVADPFTAEPGARLYRTGDFARWRADGTLEFLGRRDHQVKIRGMRVELGEIEAALSGCERIAQAAVVARTDSSGGTRLVAYVVSDVVPEDAGEEDAGTDVLDLSALVDLEEVRAALRQTLPEHMVPSSYVGLRRLPLSPSGKIDHKALPDADVSVAKAAYVAPRSETEAVVAAAFAELLGLEQVGVHDDFFALGGHSLLAVRLVGRLEAATGKTLPLRTLFGIATVEALANVLDPDGDNAQSPAAVADRLLIQLGPTRPEAGGPPLVCIHNASGLVLNYMPIARAVTPQPTFGIQALAMEEDGEQHRDLMTRLTDYVEAIRSKAGNDGPYHLLGHSTGGLYALMAMQLLRPHGPTEDDRLVLIDTHHPEVLARLVANAAGPNATLTVDDLVGWAMTEWNVVAGFLFKTFRRFMSERQKIAIARRGLLSAFRQDPDALRLQDMSPRLVDRSLRFLLQEFTDTQALALIDRFLPYDGKVLLVAAKEVADSPMDRGWGPHLPRLQIVEASGNHIQLMLQQNLAPVLPRIQTFLR